jgi:CHAD domain-containing protein
MTRLTIDQFLARNRNESVHTEYVARLALRIFDRVWRPLGIPRKDRALLCAAARLHDVGYAGNPADHVRAGVDFILKQPLAGWPPARRRRLAAVVLLHGKITPAIRRHPLLAGRADPPSILMLAAILRVADGLDHGHLQNVRIRSLRATRRGVRLEVCADGYDGVLAAAGAKADVWRRVFGRPLVLVRAPGRGARRPYAGIVRPRDSVWAAARRILFFHYRTIADQRPAAIEAASTRPLHDIRVALRRLRAALRVFGSQVADTSAAGLSHPLAECARSLRTPRDRDAWLEFLESVAGDPDLNADRRWRPYYQRQIQLRRRQGPCLRRQLEGEPLRKLLRRLALLLRVEWPERISTRPAEPLRPFAARQLRRTFKRVLAQPKLRVTNSTAEVHEVRRLCRRARYWAEFFAPVLGPAAEKLAERLWDVADALGERRDAGAGLERLVRAGGGAPAALARRLERRAFRGWKDYQAAWRRLTRRKFRRHTLQLLAALGKSS